MMGAVEIMRIESNDIAVLGGSFKTKTVTAKRGDVSRTFMFSESDTITAELVQEWWEYSDAMKSWNTSRPKRPANMEDEE